MTHRTTIRAASGRSTATGGPAGREWGEAVLVAGVLTLVLAALPHTFLEGYDWTRMHLPYKTFYREALLAGHLPWWNPYSALGRPFLADLETATLYPPNLLFLLGITAGAWLSIWLHLTFAWRGTMALARHLGNADWPARVVALSWCLGAPVQARLLSGQFQVFCTLCLLPAVFVAAARLQDAPGRRTVARLAFWSCAMALAGSPPFLWVTAVGLVVFLLLRGVGRPESPSHPRLGTVLLALVGAGLLCLIIGALPLGAMGELAGQGNRPYVAPGFALAYGMNAVEWFSLVMPPAPAFTVSLEHALFAGTPLVVAAMFFPILGRNRNARALTGLVIFMALLAAGGGTPVLGVLVDWVPGMGMWRFPSRYTVVMMFGALLLGGLVLSQTKGSAPTARKVGAVFGVVALGLLGWRGLIAFLDLRYRNWTSFGFWLGLGFASLAAIALLLRWSNEPIHTRAAARLRAGLLMLQAGTVLAGIFFLSAARLGDVPGGTEAPKLAAMLRARGRIQAGLPPPRVFIPSGLIEPNDGILYGFSTVTGFSNPELSRVWEYVHQAGGVPTPTLDYIQFSKYLGRQRGPFRFADMNLVVSYDFGKNQIVGRAQADPRAFWTDQAIWAGDKAGVLAELRRRGPGKTFPVAVEDRAAVVPGSGAPVAVPATITSFAPERVVVQMPATKAPGLLVLSESWYPGWRAESGGREWPVIPVNVWMRGVLVPAGTSDVTFVFAPGWAPGLAVVSLAGIALLLALLWWPEKPRLR